VELHVHDMLYYIMALPMFVEPYLLLQSCFFLVLCAPNLCTHMTELFMIYYVWVLLFQLPFDDEHVPTLFRKIKCKLRSANNNAGLALQDIF
jgi:hypothetical protein